MKYIVAVLLLAAGTISAQIDHRNPVLDGMMRAQEMANQVRQRELAEQSVRLLRAQEEQIRLQNEQLRRAQASETVAPLNTEEAADRVDRAINAAASRHPDLKEFAIEMGRVQKLIDSREISLDEYLEGLYLMAKYSPFSQATKPTPSPLAEGLKKVEAPPTDPR